MSQVPYAELQRIVDRFLDEVRKYPGVQNLQTDLRLNTPEVRVQHQPRQAVRHRRRRSTPSAARWKRCSAGAR